MNNVIQGPWGPPASGDPPSAMTFAGMGAYEADAMPPPPPGQPPPVMMAPAAALRPHAWGDGPLVDTSQSVTFSLPERQEAPAFASYGVPEPLYVEPAPGPYPSPAPFPVLRQGKKKGLGEPPSRASAALGLSLLLVGTGAAIGAKYRGMFGGIAGGLYAGAMVNAIRAVRSLTDGQAESDKEAAISGTYSLLGAGVATYVLYQTREKKQKG